MKGVAVDSEGRADPQTQLFRNNAVGAETGPLISQVQHGLPPIVSWNNRVLYFARSEANMEFVSLLSPIVVARRAPDPIP